jgi:hypothetical protein
MGSRMGWWVAVVAAVIYAQVCVVVPAIILIQGGSVFDALLALGFLLSTAFGLMMHLADWPPWRR